MDDVTLSSDQRTNAELSAHIAPLRHCWRDGLVLVYCTVAEVPETPIKPKKSLILALGLVLGGMFGVFIAIIRGMVKTRKE